MKHGNTAARPPGWSVSPTDGVSGKHKHAAVDRLRQEGLTETEHVQPFPPNQVINLVKVGC